MPIAHCEPRSIRSGKLSPSSPITQIASSSQRNQTGDSRGPSAEAVARWAKRGCSRNASIDSESVFSTTSIRLVRRA
jgi:hypothetical protein